MLGDLKTTQLIFNNFNIKELGGKTSFKNYSVNIQQMKKE